MTFIALLLAGLLTGPLTVRDTDGRSLSLLSPSGRQVDVVFFLSTDCPISNRYAPEIQRICADYRSKDVRCITVYPDAGDVAAVKRHRQEYGFNDTVRAVLDRDHAIVRAVGPHVTPEAAVYSSKGRMYRGRIDDLYIDVGRARREPTRHDLRAAIDAVLAGRTVAPAETEGIGCFLQTP